MKNQRQKTIETLRKMRRDTRRFNKEEAEAISDAFDHLLEDKALEDKESE